MKRRLLSAAFGSATLLLSVADAGGAQVRALLLGPGWRFDRFGPDIAVLRTSVIDAASRRPAGSASLSCDGEHRRLHLQGLGLDSRLPAGPVRMLLWTSSHGLRPSPYVAATALIDQMGSLIVADGLAGDGVLRVGKLIEGQPRRLDLRLSSISRPARLIDDTLLVFFLDVDASERRAFAEFGALCRAASLPVTGSVPP